MKRLTKEELEPEVPTWYTMPEIMGRGRVLTLSYLADTGRVIDVEHLFVAGYLESLHNPEHAIKSVIEKMHRQLFG